MKTLLLILLLSVPVLAEYVPSGTHTWYNADVDSTRIHGGGPPQNYLDGTTWKKTDKTWVVQSGNLINITNNHRSRINGVTNIAEYEFEGHIIKQRAFALFAYRRSTHQRIVLDNTPDFSNRSFVDSIVTYTDIFPNIDLKVYVRLEEMAFKWVFHQAARDAFNIWWTNNGSPDDAYLVTASRFDISAMNNMTMHDESGEFDLSADKDADGVTSFRNSGIEKFVLHKEYIDQLFWPTSDSLIQFDVHKRFVDMSGTKYLLEGMLWTDVLQIPVGDVSHNATLGNENPGTSAGHIKDRTRGNSVGAPASNGTLDSIRVFLNAGGTAGPLRMCIALATDQVIKDSTIEIASATLNTWNAAVVHVGITLSTGTSYELFGWSDGGAVSLSMESGTTGASGKARWTNTGVGYTSADWTSPVGHANEAANEQYKIVAVYTVSGGAPELRQRRRRIMLGD